MQITKYVCVCLVVCVCLYVKGDRFSKHGKGCRCIFPLCCCLEDRTNFGKRSYKAHEVWEKKQLLCHLWEVDNVLSSVEYLEEKFSDLIYNYGS